MCEGLCFSAVWTGLEPATPCVTGRYSNQLNYQTNDFILTSRQDSGNSQIQTLFNRFSISVLCPPKLRLKWTCKYTLLIHSHK